MVTRFRLLLPIYVLMLAAVFLLGIGTNQAVTVFSANAPIENQKVLIIDAGHGGEDGGAISCTGAYESQINLQIAFKLRDLMQLLGCKTILLRDTDEALHTEGATIAARKASDLKERVRIINETENAVLISIHQNHFSDSRYTGAQVFYAPTEGSNALGKLLQNTIRETINPGSNRQIKKADGIYLMQHIQVPGALIECGFLSNPQEEAKLRDPEYQKILCCVLASCSSRFLHDNIPLT